MKFSDILDLARQGYKPSDIRELLSMTESEPETKPEPETEPETKPEPETEPETKPEPEPETEPDYRKLYEETLKRLEALQKANQRQPVKEHKDNVNDIIRDAFY